jgi:hypothetical protein
MEGEAARGCGYSAVACRIVCLYRGVAFKLNVGMWPAGDLKLCQATGRKTTWVCWPAAMGIRVCRDGAIAYPATVISGVRGGVGQALPFVRKETIMTKRSVIVLTVWGFALGVIGIRCLSQGLPPCGMHVDGLFQSCPDPIRSDWGWCDAKSPCQPLYTCFPLQTFCFRANEFYPKRVTARRWELGYCQPNNEFLACPVCPSPCRYWCVEVWPTADRLNPDGSVTPCGIRCEETVIWYGHENACY